MDLKLPPRDREGHKGTFGTVVVAGGSITENKVMIGGAAIAAKASLRGGAGLVVFLGSKEVLVNLIEMVPQAIGEVFINDLPLDTEKWRSIVVGPALGSKQTNINLISILLSLKLPTVIDADGLNTIAENPVLAKRIHRDCVLTPHPQEFKRLMDAFKVKTASELASRLGCVVVLKGSRTIVCDSNQFWERVLPNPVLATGGTGDVLSGLIGGVMAQYCPIRLSVFESAILGVIIHSDSAVEWQKINGSSGLIIEELLELIPKVMDRMRTSG